MRNLLLCTLVSLGLSAEWGSSISVRTPNDSTKPLDYELSIKVENNEGKFKYLIKKDWERELGEDFVDDLINFSHNPYDVFYYGVDYVNKESKDISYITYNFGVIWEEYGLSAGVSVKDSVPLATIGFSKKLKKDDLEYNVSINMKSDINDNYIANVKSEIKKWLTSSINVFGLYKHEYYNTKEDFQFKIGIGIKI